MNVSHLPGYASEYSVPSGRRVCLDSWISHSGKKEWGTEKGVGSSPQFLLGCWIFSTRLREGRRDLITVQSGWKKFKAPRQSQATSTCHYQHVRRAGPNDSSIGIQSIDVPFINPSWVSLWQAGMQRLLDIHFPANIKSFSEWLRTRQSRNWASGGGHKPIIPGFRRQKQGSSFEFPDSQGYTTRRCLKQTIKAKRKKEQRLIMNLCLFVRTYTKRLEMLAHNRSLES